MKAWSSPACSLCATASDCRCVSASKAGERTSGTQIWIGRRPCRTETGKRGQKRGQDFLRRAGSETGVDEGLVLTRMLALRDRERLSVRLGLEG